DLFLFRVARAGAGGCCGTVREPWEGAHSGREGVELGGRRVPPPVEGGTKPLRAVGRVTGRSCRPPPGITRRTGPGSPCRAPRGAGNGGECRESRQLHCYWLMAPHSYGHLSIRSDPLLETSSNQ